MSGVAVFPIRRLQPSVAIAALLLGALQVPAAAAVQQSIALIADRLIDGRASEARTDVVVLIEGERIAAVGGREVIPAEARVIEEACGASCHGHSRQRTGMRRQGTLPW